MPTLYEIFTLRWGAEKDARIAELETANVEMHKTVTADTKRITDLETASTADHAAWEIERGKAHDQITGLENAIRGNAETHVRDVEALEAELAPFRKYVAQTAETAPAGNGANGAVA